MMFSDTWKRWLNASNTWSGFVQLQDETGGFTAFICWTFQPERTEMSHIRANQCRSSISRPRRSVGSILDNIDNIQSSWVTQGMQTGQLALLYGANDMGSLMIEENVVSQKQAQCTIFRSNRFAIVFPTWAIPRVSATFFMNSLRTLRNNRPASAQQTKASTSVISFFPETNDAPTGWFGPHDPRPSAPQRVPRF